MPEPPDEGPLTICPNRDCRLVYRPDERVYPGSSGRCPKCGTDYKAEAERRAARARESSR